MHTCTVTVDGFAGAGVVVTALVFNNIRHWAVDVDKRMLKLTDENGKVTDIAISDAATFVVTVTAFYVTSVVIAN